MAIAVRLNGLAGLFIGLAWAFPLLGRIGPVPASALSLAFPLLACVVITLLPQNRGIRPVVLPALFLAVYVVLIAQSASPSQWRFFLEPSMWMGHANAYYQSKLVTFFVSIGPLCLAAISAFGPTNRRAAITGFLLGLLLVALLGVGRTFPYVHLLIRTPERVSTLFFDSNNVGFSTLSLGVLLVSGAIAALSFNKTWPLAALFLFFAFWLNRKTEFVLIIASVLAFYCIRLRQASWRFKPKQLLLTLGIFVTAALPAVAFHNVSNEVTWQLLFKNGLNRLSVWSSAIEAGQAVTVNDPNLVPVSPLEQVISPAAVEERAKLQAEQKSHVYQFLFGRGLGWYASLGGTYSSVHNSVVENYLENGALAAALQLFVVAFALGVASRRVLHSQDAGFLALALVVAGYFIICMKAGDLTMGARLVTLALITSGLALIPNHSRSCGSLRERMG